MTTRVRIVAKLATTVIVQTIGAGLVGSSTSAFFEDEEVAVSYEQAGNIMLAGLALQIFAWVVFIAFLLVAIVRAHTQQHLQGVRYKPMRWMLWVILFSAIMLIWRACFRCAEAALGKSAPFPRGTVERLETRRLTYAPGYLNGAATNEPMFAGFEYIPVILAAGLWSIVPPRRFIEDQLPGSAQRARDAEMEKPKLTHAPSEESDASTRV